MKLHDEAAPQILGNASVASGFGAELGWLDYKTSSDKLELSCLRLSTEGSAPGTLI